MVKKLILIVGIVGAAAYVVKRVKTANEERALWHEATTGASSDLR